MLPNEQSGRMFQPVERASPARTIFERRPTHPLPRLPGNGPALPATMHARASLAAQGCEIFGATSAAGTRPSGFESGFSSDCPWRVHRRTDAGPDCSGSARSERRQLKINWDGPCAHATRSRRPAFAPIPAFGKALPWIPAPPTRRSSRVPALSSRTASVPISVLHEPSVPRPRPNMG